MNINKLINNKYSYKETFIEGIDTDADETEDGADDTDGVELPTDKPYDYLKVLQSPDKIGGGDVGTISQLNRNMEITNGYLNVTIGGDPGDVTNTKGQPLGNRYFKNTGATCTLGSGTTSGLNKDDTVKSSLYINNVADMNDGEETGLLSSAMSDIMGLSFGSVMGRTSGNVCYEVYLPTVEQNNDGSHGVIEYPSGKFLTTGEIANLNICKMSERDTILSKNTTEVNKLLNKCAESFNIMNIHMSGNNKQSKGINLKDKGLANIYSITISGILLILLYKVCKKY